MLYVRRALLALLVVACGLTSGTFSRRFLFPHRVRHAAAGATLVSLPNGVSFPAPMFSIENQVNRIPVIMYHDVVAQRGPKSVWFDCTQDEFRQQMDSLVMRGEQPVSLDQLYDHLHNGKPLPPGAIVLTFDDNYQGFYDYAYPILKEHRFPSAMFVHTNYVGDKASDHPKMDWDTLKQLDSEGLVTIGSHTLSHPENMQLLPADKQQKELVESKRVLEQKLGHPIPYLAYPSGNQDATTRDLARQAGYLMAFTTHNGPAEDSPDIMAVNRYIHTRYEKAYADCATESLGAPAAVVKVNYAQVPVQMEEGDYAGIKMSFVRGGLPASWHSGRRLSVVDFAQRAKADAGINGTFFLDARLNGTGTTLIGPSQSGPDRKFIPEPDPYLLERATNRPMVLWGPTGIAIFPFQAAFNSENALRAFMPDYTDAFLAGGWIVHAGRPRESEELKPYAVGDFDQTRRRAFLGIDAQNRLVIGASREVIGSAQLAQAAAAAGVQEAVLLDSGFSTSLIYRGQVLVTGHTAKDLPSRPVPHAILLRCPAGTQPGPLTAALTAAAGRTPEDEDQAQTPTPRRRRHRRGVN